MDDSRTLIEQSRELVETAREIMEESRRIRARAESSARRSRWIRASVRAGRIWPVPATLAKVPR